MEKLYEANMKNHMYSDTLKRWIVCTAFLLASITLPAQTKWKLVKDQQGIKVYTGEIDNVKFKSIRVVCTLDGSYEKLIKILSNVERHKDWVYKTKSATLLKKNTDHDFVYHSVTAMPWPMDNRDAVVHLVINKENLPLSLIVDAQSEPANIPKKEGLVRIPYSHASWVVTMSSTNKLQIEYIFRVNPGGSLPPWIVNMFADKGPYESFKKLAELLKQ